jgi:creatinine amidohydrolase
MNAASRSVVYMQEAIAALPAALARALEVPLPELAAPVKRVLTTGIGLSEAPARILAALLVDAGVCARFCVTSRVAHESRAEDLLVVFSQGLSPNARLALGDGSAARQRWLVTSIEPERDDCADAAYLRGCVQRGVVPIVLPVGVEIGPLVRFKGPLLGAALAMRLGAALGHDAPLGRSLSRIPECYRILPLEPASVELPLDDAPLALVSVGMQPEWVHAHRWKLLETLLRGDPPVWEALQFAHGPLQSCYEQHLTLLLFEAGRSATEPSPLPERLVRTLHPARHRVLRLSSALPAPLAFFEHAATLDALLLRAVERSGRDLFEWPARGGDGPLYDLGKTHA